MLVDTTSTSDPSSRAEEEPSLYVRFDGDRVEHLELDLPEPSRVFASELIGKDPREAPAVIEGLWGQCPVSYQIPACEALEAAMGVDVTPGIRQLRRLLYCGDWIEIHALHIYLLAPGFIDDSRADVGREAVERCLRLQRIGRALVSALGSSARHPINTAVGGFHQAPRAFDLAELRPELEWAVGASVEVLRFVSPLEFPGLDVAYLDTEMVCLHHPERYPMNEGHVISSRGRVVPPSLFEAHFARLDAGPDAVIRGPWMPRDSSYLVGPLARINMHLHQLSATALREAAACGVSWPSGNIFHSLVARGLELIHACEEAIAIIDRYHRDLPVPRVEVEPKAGRGCYAAEVPGGLAYHCYEVDSEGLIADARIVSPASLNRKQAERDLRAYLPQLGRYGQAEATRRCEQLVRHYHASPGGSTVILDRRSG
jgi:coenzyme F420-reducing hydrogenase alpha subunit